MKFLLGKKIEMTQVFKEDGTVIPVTAVLATPNVITQIKKSDTADKYNAIQIGFDNVKKLKKSQASHLKDLPQVRTLREFVVDADDLKDISRGNLITVAVFNPGDKIKVTGTSKGKGFQGVVKRHGFHGSPKTHGHKDQNRMPGSIGAGGVQRVFKGVRMAGQMGNERVTVSGLEIVDVDKEKNILFIKGAIPGARNGMVMIYGEGKMELEKNTPAPIQEKVEMVAEPVQEQAVEATEANGAVAETKSAE